MTILGKHLDALYLSVSFEFPEHLKRLFTALKGDGRGSGGDMREVQGNISGVPGGAWYIRPGGTGKYQYVMENASMWVAFSTWANMPALQIQFKAATLYEYAPEVLGGIVDTFVRFWIGPELIYKAKVSRCDVAVDFQQPDFSLPEMADVVTKARTRTVHYDGADPNTITLGKRNGALQAQIYCKSKELESVDKAWMLQVWEASGLYDKGLSVWRAELRYYREGLRGFDVDTLDELFASLGDLAEYAIGDNAGTWLRVAGPETRGENTSRRHVTGWWAGVRSAFLEGALSSGRKRKGYNPRPSFDRCVELAGAHMARAAAYSRVGESKEVLFSDLRTLSMNPSAFGHFMGESYRQQLRRKGRSWADRVNLKTAELRAVAW